MKFKPAALSLCFVFRFKNIPLTFHISVEKFRHRHTQTNRLERSQFRETERNEAANLMVSFTWAFLQLNVFSY